MENFGLHWIFSISKSYSILEIKEIDISSKNVPHFSGLSFQTGFIFHHYVM